MVETQLLRARSRRNGATGAARAAEVGHKPHASATPDR